MPIENEKSIYRMFRASILLKGAISLAEMLGGVILLFVPFTEVVAFGLFMIDLIFGSWGSYLSPILLRFAEVVSGASGLIAFYLFSRGAIKLALIAALLRNKLWAYPWSLAVLGLFMLYQTYHMIVSYSGVVLGVTLFDLVVMYFIWREYQIVKKHLSERAA